MSTQQHTEIRPTMASLSPPRSPRMLAPTSTPPPSKQRMQRPTPLEIDRPSGAPSTPPPLSPACAQTPVSPPPIKSSIAGTTGNLLNTIVGSGIVGIPYALSQSGLVAGVFLLVIAGVMTTRSLVMLIESARRVHAESYESLAASAFPSWGSAAPRTVSAGLLVLAYGAMVSYMIVVKDTIPPLMGISMENVAARAAVLVIAGASVMLPLSLQRDMASLAATSAMSCVADAIMVVLVAIIAPIPSSVTAAGGFSEVLHHSTVRPSTLFIGLGVISFAFVCQHSSFIMAESLDNPTQKRWGRVAQMALGGATAMCGLMGVCGYLGFLDDTQGNILNNFGGDDGLIESMSDMAIAIARFMLALTMFATVRGCI
mmetsp:Transcript_10493/g.20951  ORF Transcript_10493/g.20951 Transcript_10493/m.20951 type:complete len:371 (-) Transcript_10493:1503-2615(-)